MLNSKAVLASINDYYNELKSKMLTIKSHNRKILENIEGFIEIENEIGAKNFELAKLKYTGDTESAKKVQTEIDNLTLKLKDIIKSASLVKYNYECPICKDTGIVDGKRCKCYLKHISNYILKELGANRQQTCSFKSSKSCPSLKKHYEIAKSYAKTFPNTKVNNFVFMGNVGSGKTHLSKCILTELALKGFSTVFFSATELNNLFIKMHVGEADRVLSFEMLSECDLLVIDDLGTEPLYNNITVDYLLSVISTRIGLKKHFIITTNLTTDELYARYNERLLSRLSNKTETLFIPFNGEDLRRQ